MTDFEDFVAFLLAVVLIAVVSFLVGSIIHHNCGEIDSSEYIQVSEWSKECENVKLAAKEALSSDGKITNQEYAKLKRLYTERDKITAEKKAKAEILEAEKKAKESILSDNVPEETDKKE